MIEWISSNGVLDRGSPPHDRFRFLSLLKHTEQSSNSYKHGEVPSCPAVLRTIETIPERPVQTLQRGQKMEDERGRRWAISSSS
jgi:hypothetical protein